MTLSYTRWLLIAVSLAAACALVLSVQALPWWSFDGTDLYLLRSRRCFDGACQPASLAWLGASEWWHRWATSSFGLGLFAAFLAVFIAGARAAGRAPRTAAASLLVTAVVGVVCAAATWITLPAIGRASWAWGSPAYFLGLGAAAASAIAARRNPPDKS